MQPVRGFERPVLQWMFIAAGTILVATTAMGAVALRRLHAEVEQMRAADLNGRVERQRLELRLSQEQSARESFALEAARSHASAAGPEPTLTLTQGRLRTGAPPAASVSAPAPSQTILLRLVLPAAKADPARRYAAVLRGWSGGQVVWSRGDLRALTIEGQAMVTARITGDALLPGAYEVALSEVTAGGAADTASYEVAVAAPSPAAR